MAEEAEEEEVERDPPEGERNGHPEEEWGIYGEFSMAEPAKWALLILEAGTIIECVLPAEFALKDGVVAGFLVVEKKEEVDGSITLKVRSLGSCPASSTEGPQQFMCVPRLIFAPS